MRTRKDIEALEQSVLAPYAMKSKDSLGREHDNSQHEIRTCYQRDRDRIVHSEAFRKLEYKTQVFVILEGDYYRTRLTHTIEVAQIARTIGRSLQLNEDLIEAIALAHDLGHPPFGHAGEFALNELMKAVDPDGFNHNFRSYEIVTKYEKRYPEFDGLDLTAEVLVGILKHETVYDKTALVDRFSKIGPTLEAKVVDIADSLAYLSHDIDDGLTSGCITQKDLHSDPLWQRAYQRVHPLNIDDPEIFKYQIVKALIDMQTKDLLEESYKNLKKHNFRSAQEAKDYHLRKSAKPVISFSPPMKGQRDMLQRLLFEKLYRHYRVERMTEKAKRVIHQIFDVYKNNPNQLPYDIWDRPAKPNNKKKLKEFEKKMYKAVCNYIAGMTDRFALDEHKKLFNPYQKV
jgi:dGTPase